MQIISITSFNNASVSVTVPSGLSNSMLIARVGTHQGNGSSSAWNGNSLTSIAVGHSSFNENGELWGLLNPTAGTGTYSFTMSGGSWYGGDVIILSDVEQSITPTNATNNGSSASASVNITPLAGNVIILAACGSEAAFSSATPTSAQTNSQQGQSFENSMSLHYITKTGVPQTPTFSLGSGQRWGIAACAIRDFNTSPAGIPNAYRNIKLGDGMSRSEGAT